MAQLVGLSRNLKLNWLDKTIEIIEQTQDEKTIKDELNDYLGFEIESPTNIRKTREILMHIWYYDNELTKKIKSEAMELIKKHPECNLVIHWCMMLASFPVFPAICKLFGKISGFQEKIILKQIKQKIFDDWGERTTLYHSIDKIVATLKNFGVISSEKPGVYTINKIDVNNNEIINFMVYVAMMIEDAGYYEFSDIGVFDYFFPFVYNVSKECIMSDNRFTFNTFGGTLSVSINK